MNGSEEIEEKYFRCRIVCFVVVVVDQGRELHSLIKKGDVISCKIEETKESCLCSKETQAHNL